MNSSKIVKILNLAVKIFYVNFLWILFSIPLVTIGASTSAAYYTFFKIINDEEVSLLKTYFKGFKSCFGQGTILWFITAACSCGLFFIWKTVFEAGSTIGGVGAFICSLIVVIYLVYTFPLIARFNNNLKNIIRNSAVISFTFWVKTVVILLIGAVAFVLPLISKWFLLVGIFYIPGLSLFFISRIVVPIFIQIKQHEENEQKESRSESEEQDVEESSDSTEV